MITPTLLPSPFKVADACATCNETPAMRGNIRRLPGIWLLLLALIPALAHAQLKLETLADCRLVPTDWADGDSFQIETSQGVRHTIRLYGADCLEATVANETDARRLREQRRYFGISEIGGSPQASIELAKQVGRQATAETARLLERPFTVHTAFSDARGAAGFKRVYAFVTTAAGDDLAEHLVAVGLARAHGIARTTHDGRSAEQYRGKLRDLELRAAKLGLGVWAETDWERLPDERQLERDEAAELAMATGRVQPTETVDPNTAAPAELMAIPGIGEVTARRIIEARPFASVADLDRVAGVGPKVLERISPFLAIRDAEAEAE